MKLKFLSLTFLISLCAFFAQATSADWYLYVWSESANGDLGQFETMDDADVFIIKSCNIPVQGIKFCVRNGDWSTQYGWKAESVTTLGVDVELAPSTAANGWLGLPVGDYKVTFNASAQTIRFDEVDEDEEIELTPQVASFLRGGDLTMVSYLEDWGTVFRYKDGKAGDVFDILQEYGINFARLRLFNNPGTAVNENGTLYRMPIKSPKHTSGYAYAGLEDILNLAQRAKAHNMKICLSIYLSDYWSGAAKQYIPQAWENITTTSVLGDSVYNYVFHVMSCMAAQGTIPEYVSIGNESNYGILFNTLDGSKVTFGGHTDNMTQCVALFNRAYDAVKAVSPTTQIAIHHSYGHDGKIGICRNFFKSLVDNGCKFDIVGGSYYPYWASVQNSSDNTPTGMLTWAADMENNIGKPVMIMEVGYSWTPYRPADKNGGNYEGQLHLNGSYNEATEAGQENFIHALHEAIKTDENIIGYLYWDPIFVDQKVNNVWSEVCWAERYDAGYDTWWQDGNIISNTTLFNYTGYPLSALYREIAAFNPATQKTAIENIPNSTTHKIFRDNQILIVRDNKTYSLMGFEIK